MSLWSTTTYNAGWKEYYNKLPALLLLLTLNVPLPIRPSICVCPSILPYFLSDCMSVCWLAGSSAWKVYTLFCFGAAVFYFCSSPLFAHHLATDRIHLYIHKPVCLSVHQSFSRLGSPLSSSSSPQLLKNRCMNWSLIYRFTHAYNRLSEKPIESHTLRG